MCDYCNNEQDFNIKEAWVFDKDIKEELNIFVEESHLTIDYKNAEADGFYIDINYCPMCGRKLEVK